MEKYTPPYAVYVKTDEAGRITTINSSEFLTDTEGWTKIDEGYGDRYHHAQGNYLPGPLMDDLGVYRYKLVDGKAVERTQSEMDADYIPSEPQSDLTAEVAALRESNAQLQEALDLLLSGEVE